MSFHGSFHKIRRNAAGRGRGRERASEQGGAREAGGRQAATEASEGERVAPTRAAARTGGRSAQATRNASVPPAPSPTPTPAMRARSHTLVGGRHEVGNSGKGEGVAALLAAGAGNWKRGLRKPQSRRLVCETMCDGMIGGRSVIHTFQSSAAKRRMWMPQSLAVPPLHNQPSSSLNKRTRRRGLGLSAVTSRM